MRLLMRFCGSFLRDGGGGAGSGARSMREILIATSNAGKLRDFAAAAASFQIAVAPVAHLGSLPAVREDAPTLEANACKKAEHYSRFAPGHYVLADDSGLEVEALQGAPGVHSARFAAALAGDNASDAANNARLLHALADTPNAQRAAKFVCCLAVARDGRTVVCFRGDARGTILRAPRGQGGFGYDPLFWLPEAGKSFAELSAEEKAAISHRGQAFRKFLRWFASQSDPAAASPAARRLG